jgi:hypothetical protein
VAILPTGAEPRTDPEPAVVGERNGTRAMIGDLSEVRLRPYGCNGHHPSACLVETWCGRPGALVKTEAAQCSGTIVVGVDGSGHAGRAVETVAEIAAGTKDEVVVCHGVVVPHAWRVQVHAAGARGAGKTG